jgi:hypothetical protein
VGINYVIILDKVYSLLNNSFFKSKVLLSYGKFNKEIYIRFRSILTRAFGFGFYYLRGLIFLLFIDACLTDDEPLWEPIEWSLVQT